MHAPDLSTRMAWQLISRALRGCNFMSMRNGVGADQFMETALKRERERFGPGDTCAIDSLLQAVGRVETNTDDAQVLQACKFVRRDLGRHWRLGNDLERRLTQYLAAKDRTLSKKVVEALQRYLRAEDLAMRNLLLLNVRGRHGRAEDGLPMSEDVSHPTAYDDLQKTAKAFGSDIGPRQIRKIIKPRES